MQRQKFRLTNKKHQASNDEEVTLILSEITLLLSDVDKINVFLRDVVCEIMLRDIEYLLTRYLMKTRKSFTRMHWEEEEEPVAVTSSKDESDDSTNLASAFYIS